MTNSSFSKHNIYLVLAVSSMIGFCLSSQEACYGQEQFFEMIRQNDVEHVQRIISVFPDEVNSKDKSSTTPLHVAAKAGSCAVVRCLLRAGAYVNSKDNKMEWRSCIGGLRIVGGNNTPLHWASRCGHEDVVRLLLASSADVNAQDREGWTPLHFAARYGHQDVVQLLLTGGADVNSKDNNIEWRSCIGGLRIVGGNNTPLHWASRCGHEDVVRLLLASSADVNAQDREGWTPLHFAARYGHQDVVQLLLTGGADVNARVDRPLKFSTHTGYTPLHFAARYGHQDVVQLLLAGGADVNAQRGFQPTPLHYAAQYGRQDVVRVLLEHGADVNVWCDCAETPLRWAAENGRQHVVKMLLANGADIEERAHGITALEEALSLDDHTIAKCLVKRYANVGGLQDEIRRIAPGLLEKRQNDLVEIFNKTELPTDLMNLVMILLI